MAELIATGNTAVDSADFTVTAGVPVTLYIKPPSGTTIPPNVFFVLQYKTAAGAYIALQPILNQSNIMQFGVISGGGTFRVSRLLSADSAGMDYV